MAISQQKDGLLLFRISGISRNKLRGVLRFPRNHSTVGVYRGRGGGMMLGHVADGAPTLILNKRWVTLIVIINMQPCLWNAYYAIM